MSQEGKEKIKRTVEKPKEAIERVQKFTLRHKAKIIDFDTLIDKANIKDKYQEYINIKKEITIMLIKASDLAEVIVTEVNKKV